eukprot:maker-scaffold344_size201325-snap-gene-1.23 protein:Tk02545 transcript:maker-scaffold344_size201325-snap-gene-1.23-mRNA-1 annotation:"Calsequestrin-1 precursor "
MFQEIEKDEGIFVLNAKNYDKAVKEYKYLLVEFHAPWCGHCKALAPEYVKAAQELKERDSEIKLAKVDGTEEQELMEKMHIKGYPTIFFYRDGEPIDYSGGRMANEIAGWVEKKTGPPALVLESAEKVKDYIDDSDVAVVGFFKDADSDLAKKYKAAVRDYEEYPCAITSDEQAIKDNKVEDGQVVLFKKFDEGRAVRVVEFLGLKNEKMPTLRIIQMTEMDVVKYKPETEEFSKDNLEQFVKDFLDKKVPVHYLSDDIPEDWDKNPVKTLVGKNFDEVAFNKDKNVLVEFYAPWCGHCKQLVPIWEEVAEFLSKKDDMVVAKMDSTTNELSHTKVRSFPTIKLFKKGDNEAVEYNGERTLEGITKFLASGGEYGKAAPDHDEL